jgi:hypothetical protein
MRIWKKVSRGILMSGLIEMTGWVVLSSARINERGNGMAGDVRGGREHECAVPAIGGNVNERCRSSCKSVGRTLGLVAETVAMLREYGLCIHERSSGNAHDTHRHALVDFPPHR